MIEQVFAYATSRALKRETDDAVRHAVDLCAHTSGAHDALCGKQTAVFLGVWDSENPKNCVACTRALGKEVAA